jgi:hypothetical protein
LKQISSSNLKRYKEKTLTSSGKGLGLKVLWKGIRMIKVLRVMPVWVWM